MSKIKNKLFILVVLLSLTSFGQEIKNSDLKSTTDKLGLQGYYTSDKKLGFTEKDSLFQVNIGFRIQSRAGYQKTERQSGTVEGEVKRMRLKLDGFIYNPKFGYKVELGLSSSDLGVIKAGNNENLILDAVFFYKPTRHFTIAFGQAKLPGNNQRIVSSGALEFTDRTINNSSFNIDRDFGLFLDYENENPSQFSYALKGALTKGEGRNWTKTKDDGVSLTGKIEVFPLGSFTKKGHVSEGDLVKEKTIKWMISGSFNQNNNAVRAQGQLGNDLYESRTIQSLFFDTVLKYNGWAASGAYMSRTCSDPITISTVDSTKKQAVYAGHGIDTQLSYVFASKYQIAGRFSTQQIHHTIHDLVPNTEEFAMSFSKYLLGHKLKIQSEVSYENKKYKLQEKAGGYSIRFQVEIGI